MVSPLLGAPSRPEEGRGAGGLRERGRRGTFGGERRRRSSFLPQSVCCGDKQYPGLSIVLFSGELRPPGVTGPLFWREGRRGSQAAPVNPTRLHSSSCKRDHTVSQASWTSWCQRCTWQPRGQETQPDGLTKTVQDRLVEKCGSRCKEAGPGRKATRERVLSISRDQDQGG